MSVTKRFFHKVVYDFHYAMKYYNISLIKNIFRKILDTKINFECNDAKYLFFQD